MIRVNRKTLWIPLRDLVPMFAPHVIAAKYLFF